MQFGIVGGETIGSALVPQQGFSPVGAPSPGGWVTTPSDTWAVAQSVTLATGSAGTYTIDWSRAGYFQFVEVSGTSAFTLAFANASVGQTIFIQVTQYSTSTATTLTLPSGTIVAGTAAATQSLTHTNSAIDLVQVTCTAPGVYLAVFN